MEMQFKSGGFTVAIDGEAVHKTAAGTRARESVVVTGATSGHTGPVTFVDQPDTERRRLAEFLVALAAKHHETLIRTYPGPALKWFAPDASGRAGFQIDQVVAVRKDLEGDELAGVVMHEVRHLAQQAVRMDDDEAELDADTFVSSWKGVYMAAHRAADGLLSRVRFVDGRPPWRGFSHQDVAISRTTKRAYLHNVRNVGSPWTELPR
jgi:hypothetical protein